MPQDPMSRKPMSLEPIPRKPISQTDPIASPQRLDEALQQCKSALLAKGFEDPAQAARSLLVEGLGVDPLTLLVQPETRLSAQQSARLAILLAPWQPAMSLARLLGEAVFRNTRYQIDASTLEPRADSGALIDLALRWAATRNPPDALLDLGSGSGIIGLELAQAWPESRVILADISAAALAVAAHNSQRLGLAERVRVIQSDWFTAISGRFDLLIANPPYIADGYPLDASVRDYDPALALYAGKEGLDALRILLAQGSGYLRKQGALMLEIGFDQAEKVKAIAAQEGWRLWGFERDLGNQIRALAFTRFSG